MATMAKWNKKSFSVTTKKLEGITDFQTTYAMKSDSNEDTSGTTTTNTRGRAAEEPAFTVRYMAATGSKPRAELDSWRDLVGVKDYLYIGGTKYGKNKFELMSAAVSSVLFDSKGNMIQAHVNLKFKEDMPVTKKATSKASKSKTATTKSKSAAKKATPTKADKVINDPYNMPLQGGKKYDPNML